MLHSSFSFHVQSFVSVTHWFSFVRSRLVAVMWKLEMPSSAARGLPGCLVFVFVFVFVFVWVCVLWGCVRGSVVLHAVLCPLAKKREDRKQLFKSVLFI